ncbi:hypothetical protein BABINDRAFT_41061, partial [Babjeviella inositovora NRRL Y-12698]
SMSTHTLYPQAATTQLPSRVKNDTTALYLTAAPPRATKRATAQVNYAELDNDTDFLLDEEKAAHSQAPSVAAPVTQVVPARVTPHQYHTPAQLETQASAPEVMVPIRLNLEHASNNNSRLVDFFMWNLHESLCTPEHFAQLTCHDLDLPGVMQGEMARSIRVQLEEHATIARAPLTGEVHAVVHLQVSLGSQLLADRLEWDLSDTTYTPERFAGTVVADMGLALEFKPAIAHAMHETLLRLKRDVIEGTFAYEVRNFAYSGVPRETTATQVLVQAGLRIDLDRMNGSWAPVVETLTQWEIEKREIERERNLRRLKRETMRVVPVEDKRRGGYKRRYDELEGTMRPVTGW